MESLLVLFVHNRPKILMECLKTLFNTSYIFDEVLVINDSSNAETTNLINDIIKDNPQVNFNLIHFIKNQGYGGSAEFAFQYVKMRNPKWYFHIESDYIFRRNWVEEVIAVLEASPKTLAISGYSHPDFYLDNKINKDYPEGIIREYGSDPIPRQYLYKPFKLNTKIGEIEVQGTSNSAGCCYVNWQNFIALNNVFPDFWEKVMDRAANKFEGGNRRTYGDGPFSHGSCWFFYNYYKDIDFSKEFAWLDICNSSISNHIAGGEDSINGYIVPEGYTFVGSPKWKV